MQRFLSPHPDWPCEAVSQIAVEVARIGADRLSLLYRLTAGPGLVIPPPGPAARTDGLWKHTCFEAFLRVPGAAGYVELNLSPSGEWAAYRFEAYRDGMAAADIAAPQIAWTATDGGYELSADLDAIPDLAGRPWRLGLSAVIEETAGRSSYWALAHPPGRADFHHDDGFALDLPAS
jgi:hypothetical protein